MNLTQPKIALPGPAALRALAKAFSDFGEFDRFVAGLQTALAQSAAFEHTAILLDRAVHAGKVPLVAGSLSVPLVGGGLPHGFLQAAPRSENRQFAAEDLHLLAGLADFLSAVLDQAVRRQEAQRSQELLRFLLNQAPIGLAAYTPERRLLVANDLGRDWLGEAGPPFLEIESGHGNFHLRAAGKLIFGEARRAPDGVWVIALHDLTPGQVRLIEALQRETFRGLVEEHPVSFALVESPQVCEGVLRQLPALRQALAGNEVVGPYDANRIGIVMAGMGGSAARHRLRQWQGLLGDVGTLRVGVAELRRDGSTSETMLAAALRRSGPFGETVRPTVLVHDNDSGVASSISLILGREYRVLKSMELGATREILRREEVDVFVTDLDLRGEVSGTDLVQEVRRLQPTIRPLFTSVHDAPHELTPELAAGGAVVLQKPFAPDVLREALRNRLGT